MVLGLSRRVQGTGLAARLVSRLLRTAPGRGYVSGELSQVYEDHVMSRMLERMGFPVVRRYAVLTRRLEG